MTAPRIIVSGATMAITRRTTMRKAFLAPWHPLVPQIWLYALAEAQRRTNVDVHHGICVINHHHLTVTPSRDNLPEFTTLLHHDVSCALNTLLARQRYDAPGGLFDDRSGHYMRLLDAPAQASQLVYEYNNCVAAGLVSRPEHMPGHRFDFDLWRTGYIDVERPPIYFSADRPESTRLYVTPPPLLYAAFGGDLDWLIYHMKRTSEHTTRTLRMARTREPLGARRVERLHPWSEPRTLRETGGSRIPSFRLGARDILGRQVAAAAALETREFRRRHHDARVARSAGDHESIFPFGTYEMRVRHGAPFAPEPDLDAIVTRPGPLLCDIQRVLHTGARHASRDEHRVHAIELLDEVRAAISDEAIELCTEDELDFDRAPRAVRGQVNDSTSPDTAVANEPAIVRRRSFAPRQDGDVGVRRIVVLRDRRRGRPPGAASRHGADPPA